MDVLENLFAPEGVIEDVAAPEPVEAPAEPNEGRARGPDGKFVAKEPEPAPAEAAPPEAPAQVAASPAPPAPASPPVPEPEKPPHGYVPLATTLDERDKRQAAEKRAKELEDKLKAFETPQQPAPAAPDRYEDPEGFEAFQQQQLENRLFNERANFSERFARKEHGDELVTAAQAWAKDRQASDPGFAQRIRTDADPYEFVVAEYKRDQMVSTLQPTDWEAFQQWKAARDGGAPPTPPAVLTPPTPPPTPPQSLAGQPSAGGAKPGEQPAGPGVAFGSLFKSG